MNDPVLINVEVICRGCGAELVTSSPIEPFECICCGHLVTKNDLKEPLLKVVEDE